MINPPHRKCFLMFRGNLLCQIVPCLCCSEPLREPGSIPCAASPQLDEIPLKLLQAEQSWLYQPFSWGRCSCSSVILVALCWSLSCTGEPSTGCSTPDVASPLLDGGEGSPPSTCWQCFASCCDPSAQQRCTVGSCSA